MYDKSGFIGYEVCFTLVLKGVSALHDYKTLSLIMEPLLYNFIIHYGILSLSFIIDNGTFIERRTISLI